MKSLGIVEMYAVNWLKKKMNISEAQQALVMEFAREIQDMMYGKEENEN